MKHLKSYKIFEIRFDLDDLAHQFISEMSEVYDLRLGRPFDKEKANCSWFSREFFNWVKSRGLDVKLVYFDSEIEAHIAPMIDGQIIDFVFKQFNHNPAGDYKIAKPEDYVEFGYDHYEILDEIPNWLTIREPDMI